VNISPEVISLIDEIKNDKTHGASQLARRAAEVMKIAAEHSQAKSTGQFWREHRQVGEKLMSARPAMAPVFNMVSALLGKAGSDVKTADLASIRRLTMTKADELIEASLKAVARIAQHGAQLIADGDRIMTHSYSSTVVAVLKEASARCQNIEVITTRSGPGLTGQRLARELSGYGIAVTFIDDAAVGLYISGVTKAVVGADRVCADGKVVNGIGTYQLALAAERAGVPLYVLCEMLKFDPRLRGDEVDLEEKEAEEVAGAGRLPPQVKVKNPYFDITPPELVSGIVTENGLLTPQQVIGYMKERPDKAG
jgi:ribose 1,5-bisphosphate isomerase